jgi:exodeoxyribonuclease-3
MVDDRLDGGAAFAVTSEQIDEATRLTGGVDVEAMLGRGFVAATAGVGDLNVAPLEHDVWSHKQMLKVVSHTPVECEKLVAARDAGGWFDVMRKFVPESEKLYTWWSYRSMDWEASNRGRRLDHVWVSPALADRVERMTVTREARAWTRPSDHVPVTVAIEA